MADGMNVYTYGSLMFPPVWQTVVRGVYRSEIASVHGFRRVCVRNAHHPALIISRHARPLAGRLYFDVSAGDIGRLDHFETVNYQRVTVAVAGQAGAVVAQAFLAVNPDLLTDIEWCEITFERVGLPLFLATYAVENRPKD